MANKFTRSFKQYFLTGLFVMIPVVLSVFTVGWFVNALDRMFGGLIEGLFGFRVPGLGIFLAVIVLVAVGMLLSTNIMAQNIFDFFEDLLLRVPGLSMVYKTVKALTDAFSPQNQKSFRGVALVDYPCQGSLSIGFITGQVDMYLEGGGTEKHLSVYVPTNHLYLGNTIILPESKVMMTGLTVQQGIQIIISSGAGLPDQLPLRKS